MSGQDLTLRADVQPRPEPAVSVARRGSDAGQAASPAAACHAWRRVPAIALVRSVVYMVYTRDRPRHSQIPLLASGAVVVGDRVRRAGRLRLSRRLAGRAGGRGGRAMLLAMVGGGRGDGRRRLSAGAVILFQVAAAPSLQPGPR